MKLSYKWLKSYFDKEIPTPEKLAELFTFHFSEVESVEEVTYDGQKDYIFDLKILPDRAHYALSHGGVAKEISVLTGLPLKKDRIPGRPEVTSTKEPKVKIEDTDFCRRYMACYVEGIDNEPAHAPFSVKSYLEPIGQRIISPIVDATNMAMFDSGQPMHAFDADKVEGTLVVRSAKEGEKITLLDDREITLTKNDHVIADDKGPLVVAGVKGGKRAQVTTATKNIILESANFHPAKVRVTSTKYDLRSESSKRYENEITPELTDAGFDSVLPLLKGLCPKAKFGPIIDIYPKKPVETLISIDSAYISARLGIKIPEKEIERILASLDIKIDAKKGEWKLTIPFVRLDLINADDIVEEIGRIYGYEKINGILPETSIKPAVLPAFYYAEKIRTHLTQVGFSEVYTYSLVAKGDIEIEKPLAMDKNHLRTSLTEGIVKSLTLNAKNADLLGLDEVKIFEIGQIFPKAGEHTSLTIGIKNIKKKQEKENEKIKKVRDELFKALGVNATILCTVDDTGGIISINKKNVGVTNSTEGIMEINLDEVVKALPVPASYADLDLKKAPSVKYKPFSVYPFIIRDIALFVPETVSEKEVWDEIEKGIADEDAQDWLVRHEIFDVFKKDGKTSYAFRLVFQSMDQTLTDEEANDVMEKIYFRVKEKGWQVR